MKSPFDIVIATMTITTFVCAGCTHTKAPDSLAGVHSAADPSPTQYPAPTPAVMTVSETTAHAGPNGGDQITKAILRDHRMAGSHIAAVVDSNGTATLVGFVKSRDQELTALKTAQQVAGVTGVFDRLEIVPTAVASTTQSNASTMQSSPSAMQSKPKVVDRLDFGSEDEQVNTPRMAEPYRIAADDGGSSVPPDRGTDVTVNVNVPSGYGNGGYGGYGGGNYADTAAPIYPVNNDAGQTVLVVPSYPSAYTSYFAVGGLRNFESSRTHPGSHYAAGTIGHGGTHFVERPSASNGFPIFGPSTGHSPVNARHGFR